jgi:CelD/BcsL family acetyltransferase involved in cellulose biosynthesis
MSSITQAFEHSAGRNANGTLTFATHRGHDGLLALESQWAQVIAKIEHPHFFQQFAWYDVALQTWPEEARDIHFVVAYRGDQAVAIFPLQLTRSRDFRVPVRLLTPPDPNSIAYSDFIYARTHENVDLFPSLLGSLRSDRNLRWDVLMLPKVFSTASVLARPLADAGSRGVFEHPRGVCYYFRCDEGTSAITSRISSGLRKHLRRCRRQLSSMGNLEFVSSRDPAALPDLFEEFLHLEASGWKGESGERSAIRLDPSLRAFYGGELARFAEAGGAEINLLRLGSRTIAGQYCLISSGTWYHLKIAYDEEFHVYSPGFVLLEEVLDRLCQDDAVHTANFLTGAEWADRWHPHELQVTRIVARSNSLKGHLALAEIRARRFVRDRVVTLRRPRSTETTVYESP